MADGSRRKSKRLEIIGEEYVFKAFEFARQADPDAQPTIIFIYNEYDLEYGLTCDKVIRLIGDLRTEGARVAL